MATQPTQFPLYSAYFAAGNPIPDELIAPKEGAADIQLIKGKITTTLLNLYIDRYGIAGFGIEATQAKNEYGTFYNAYIAQDIDGQKTKIPITATVEDIFTVSSVGKKKASKESSSEKEEDKATFLVYSGKQFIDTPNGPAVNAPAEEMLRCIKRVCIIVYRLIISIRPNKTIFTPWKPCSTSANPKDEVYNRPNPNPYAGLQFTLTDKMSTIKTGPNAGKPYDPSAKIRRLVRTATNKITAALCKDLKLETINQSIPNGSQMMDAELKMSNVFIGSGPTGYIGYHIDVSKFTYAPNPKLPDADVEIDISDARFAMLASMVPNIQTLSLGEAASTIVAAAPQPINASQASQLSPNDIAGMLDDPEDNDSNE